MREHENEGIKEMNQKMILDLGEGISKNDFQNPKVEQIQKMISEIQSRLYAETDKESRIDIIYNGLKNVYAPIVLEWDMDKYDVVTMEEIFNQVCTINPFKTVMALPKSVDIIDNKEYLKKVYNEIGEILNGSNSND